MSSANVRMQALKALGLISRGKVLPKEALAAMEEGLPRRDRALLMELVFGVLRHRSLLDHLVSGFLGKPPKDQTANNLRLAVYQIFFTRIPESAAVNEAVNMEEEKNFGGGKPALVNAVLRTMLRSRKALDEDLARLKARALNPALDGSERTKAIATLTSHPLWLVKRWARRFGAEGALELASAGNRVPPLVLRVNTIKKTRMEALQMLAEKAIEAEPAGSSPAGIKILGHADKKRVTFRELEFLHPFCTIQDEAAQLAGFLLDPKPGETVLDACAAPGGKTTHIAELMKDSGHIVAADIDGKRLRRLRENIDRLGLRSVRVVETDITDESGPLHTDPELSLFDRVLLDAPCSSLGVIRRNPDVRYRHSEKELARFGARQLSMLIASAKKLKVGGALVYSTCSTEPEEGEMVIGDFLDKTRGRFALDEEMPPFLLPFREKEKGFFRTYPHREDMDGFFMAKLRKLC